MTLVTDAGEYAATAAKQALTRPSDYAAFDDRWYTTHGCVAAMTENADDILAESNYLTTLATLEGAVAHDETGASEDRGDDVCDTGAHHWAVGPVRELFVRVYTDDDRTTYTPAFMAAVGIAQRLERYPILDESDYCERERVAWETTVTDAIDQAEHDYPHDAPWQRAAVWHMLTGPDSRYRDRLYDETDPSDPSYDTVAEIYRDTRHELLDTLAAWWFGGYSWPPELRRPQPGQESLPGL